jgi:glutaredoxin 3
MAPVTLYTKTYCHYSKQAKALLSEKGVDYDDIDVTEDEARFSEMTECTGGATTVPQIFIRGRHIGGLSELVELDERGGLDSLQEGESPAASP